MTDLAELALAYDVAAAATAEPHDHTDWRYDAVRDAFPACRDVDQVALVDGEVVGAALSFRDDGGVRVRLVGVAPEHQRSGVGARLMAAVEAAAWAAGDHRIYLGAELGAVGFYRSAGYSLVARAYGVVIFEKTPLAGRRVSITADAAWLPEGSDAEVFAWDGPTPPEPVCLVRVASRRGDQLFLAETAKGPDLPTRFVAPRPAEGEWRCALAALLAELGLTGEATCIGFVRNVVPAAAEGYPYSVPHAHFAVFEVTGEPAVPGTWAGPADAERKCAERHWWPVWSARLSGEPAGTRGTGGGSVSRQPRP